jgi:hypothetical protein
MMGRQPAQRESFIVRVRWKPEQVAQEVWIQHVRSGETAVVHDLNQAVAFIERWAEPDAAQREPTRTGLQ